MNPRARRIAAMGALLALVVAAFAVRAPLGRAMLAATLDIASGYRIAFDRAAVGPDVAELDGLVVDDGRLPLLRVRRLRARYDLRGLLPGGRHRFGLTSLYLEEPSLTLYRRADGTFDLHGLLERGTGAPSPAGGEPFDATVYLRRGRVTVLDPNRRIPISRRLTIGAIDGAARIDSATRSVVRVHGEWASDRRQPFVLAGTFDAERGYAIARLLASRIQLPALADYFINTPSAAVMSGDANDVGVTVYGFAVHGKPFTYHLAGSARLAGGVLRVPGMLEPLRSVEGRLDLNDGGLAAPRWRGSLASEPVVLSGELYDWQAPAFEVGVDLPRFTLSRVRRLFAFSRRLPLSGSGRLTILVEGPVATPVVVSTFELARAAYSRYPVTTTAGKAAYYADGVDVIGASGGYGGVALNASGAYALDPAPAEPPARFLVEASAPGSRVPYLAALAAATPLRGAALITGGDGRYAAAGVLSGSDAESRVEGTFSVNASGDGSLGPVTLDRSGGRLAGAFELHRSKSESAFWTIATGYPYAASTARLPGLGIEQPVFAGTLYGALAGMGRPSSFRLAGSVAAKHLRAGVAQVDSVAATVCGAPAALRVSAVTAHGPWGRFSGGGSYARGALALSGRYAGSFSEVATLTGNLQARGPIDGPATLVFEPGRALVQVREASMRNATLAGVPLTSLAGTFGVSEGSVRVYAATARIGGGLAAAAGTLPRGVGLSLGRVAAAGAIRIAGVTPGALNAIGTVRSGPGGPRFVGAAAVSSATVRGQAAMANGDVLLSQRHLTFYDVDGEVGTASGKVNGVVSASGPAFDLGLDVAAAPLASLLPDSRFAAEDLAGTAAANLHVWGRPPAYRVAGTVGVSEGMLHGLPFRSLRMRVALTAGALNQAALSGPQARGADLKGERSLALATHSAAAAWTSLVPPALRGDVSDGSVTVGSTRIRFAASAGRASATAALSIPHADLSDFDDYFDAGEALAGRGHLALNVTERNGTLSTHADVGLRALRYQRFELGNADARWRSKGRTVVGSAAFGGPSGTVAADARLLLPPSASAPRELMHDVLLEGTARVRRLDLGVWFPTLGYRAPVGGRLDADAQVAGRLSDPTLRTNVNLIDASAGTVPVRRLTFSATSTLHRTTVSDARLQLPSVAIVADGSFGPMPHDPIDLTLRAASSNLGIVAGRFLGAAADIGGRAQAEVHLSGTRLRPVVAGSFDVSSGRVRGVSVPHAVGQFRLHGHSVVLNGVQLAFTRGALDMAGSLPLGIVPFGFGPAPAPVALQGDVRGIDLADFAPLLPAGSQLGGTLEGTVAVEGTAGSPRLAGSVSLANGMLRTPAETVPLEDVAATMSLSGQTATLERLTAHAGGGTLEASGSATVPSLGRDGAGRAYAFRIGAKGLRLDSPVYGVGQFDGEMTVAGDQAAAPSIGGALALSNATIPFAALLTGSQSGAQPVLPFDPVLDLRLSAGPDVRIRSANVDIGVTGGVHVGGDLTAPQLRGTFASTGGTLAYLDTVFRLDSGIVRFTPDQGLIPTLHAVATAHVIDPDPNTVRNASGSADITLHLNGPVTGLTIAVSSEPAYDREQILGLLLGAPALGASNLFGETPGSPTLYGSNSTVGLSPAVVSNRNPSGELNVTQEAFGFANAQFTRTLLAPFETSFAQAVGLSNFNLNVDYTGDVGVQARKLVGKKVNALFGTSFGYPYRQTFGVEYKPNPFSAAQLTLFQTLGATGLNSLTPTASITNTSKLQAAQPQTGTLGVSFSLQRLFP